MPPWGWRSLLCWLVSFDHIPRRSGAQIMFICLPTDWQTFLSSSVCHCFHRRLQEWLIIKHTEILNAFDPLKMKNADREPNDFFTPINFFLANKDIWIIRCMIMRHDMCGHLQFMQQSSNSSVTVRFILIPEQVWDHMISFFLEGFDRYSKCPFLTADPVDSLTSLPSLSSKLLIILMPGVKGISCW